jgi:hypothetical protein
MFVPSDREAIIWIYNICGLVSGVLMAVLNHKLCAKLFSGTTLPNRADTKELGDVNDQNVSSDTNQPKENNKSKDSAILSSKSNNPFDDL